MLDPARVSVATLARRISAVVAEAHSRPVVIERHGQPVAALVSADAYARAVDRAEVLEDLYWSAVALKQEAEWQGAGRPVVSTEEVTRRG